MIVSWIKLHKKIANWQWYSKSETFHFFIHCLLNANYEDAYWKGILIKRGQLVIGRKKVGKILGLSEQQVRTCISNLKSTNEITTKATNKFTIITICKYDSYQFNKGQNQPTSNQQTNHHINGKSTTLIDNKSIINNNILVKQEKNEKNNFGSIEDNLQGTGALADRLYAKFKNI